ncbi:hypothetical protein Acr_15g0005140 [Actinidia rufa]|uniref:Uncharacterized protein n=1 Tax=Actinidia rufa TaxID=165716 RepID=A0A7J0FT83_9ERIC|nr:hypothetical protein Acr_15g0005140 [Actinidia rufa]
MSGSRDRDRHIDSTGPVDNEEEGKEEEANEASEEQISISSSPQLVGDDTESSDAYAKASTSESNSRKCSNKDKLGGERTPYSLSISAQYVNGSIPKAWSTYKKLFEPIQLQFLFEQILHYPDDMFFIIPNDIAEAHFLPFRESDDSCWKEFVTARKWKEGDVIRFYKSTEYFGYKFYHIECVKIPPNEGEKHFRSLKYPDGAGYYKKEKLLVSDAENTGWPMEIRFLPGYNNYIIFGNWSRFVVTHKLKPPDVIRLFKVVKNAAHKNHYVIDYVQENKAATCETSPVGPGKEGKHNSGGSSQKHGNVDKS